MNERLILTIDASAVRESYSTPNCKRFAFETSDLIQKSGGDPTPSAASGFLGNFSDSSSLEEGDVSQ